MESPPTSIVSVDGLEVRRVVTGPYSNNTYIVVCPETNESVIIDTPAEPEVILKAAEGTKVIAIFMTHCHMDHIAGHKAVKNATGAPVWVHPSEADKLPLPPEHLFQHGGSVSFGTVTFRTIHVPGHTTGGTCLLWKRQLFSGDTLFPNGPGRTMSPKDFQQLVGSLKQRIFVLPDEVNIYPGHGGGTVLGREKQQFQVFSQRPHRPDLCGDVLWLSS